jgi:hypothetical protein
VFERRPSRKLSGSPEPPPDPPEPQVGCGETRELAGKGSPDDHEPGKRGLGPESELRVEGEQPPYDRPDDGYEEGHAAGRAATCIRGPLEPRFESVTVHRILLRGKGTQFLNSLSPGHRSQACTSEWK